MMPRLAASVFRFLNRVSMRRPRQHPVLALTLARLANAPGQAAIALGGVLASFSLMVAMAIMVSSFRISLDDWMMPVSQAPGRNSNGALSVRCRSAGLTADRIRIRTSGRPAARA
jgi:hypothetical protein